MAEQGEAAFRDLEGERLRQAVTGPEAVIALGGGALLRAENRLLAEQSGRILLLTAEFPTLLERAQREAEARPLLAGDLPSRLENLLRERRAHYDSFPLRLQVDGLSPDELTWRAQVMAGRFYLSAMGEYEARVGDVSELKFAVHLIVTDENVARHHLQALNAVLRARGMNPPAVILPPGEKHKNIETVMRLWQAFLSAGLDRHSTALALGGGVIGDLTGFAAATYMRGIRWAILPTTLLAMADAALGGKTGFDLPEGKNLIGAFHPPLQVLADPRFLRTLPEEELRSGMAEIVKHGMIADPELFAWCGNGLEAARTRWDEILKRAMAVKIRIIEADPYEKGARAALNFGHTIGHAVELASGFRLRHGEAVAIGMVAETRLAERLKLAEAGTAAALTETLAAIGLPTEIPSDLKREEVIRAMKVDKKKARGIMRFALPRRIGEVRTGVEIENLEEAL
jgi:3-dehydroquinate synthase